MQTITVDMTPGFRQPTIHYSQNDVGTTFAIDLRSRFGDTLPASPTVKIQATKPSGFGFSIEADSVVGSLATFTTVDTMTDEAGRFQAELQIIKDAVVIYTANFYMEGEANPHPIGTTDGSQETIIPTLTLLVERVEAAASSVLDMTVEAETLAAGSQATYSYDEDTNTATFGIPQGEAGAGAVDVTASAYSSSRTYAVGDYVIHNDYLYRCTTAITTAEAWTSGHWTQVLLVNEVSDVKSALNNNYVGFRRYLTSTDDMFTLGVGVYGIKSAAAEKPANMPSDFTTTANGYAIVFENENSSAKVAVAIQAYRKKIWLRTGYEWVELAKIDTTNTLIASAVNSIYAYLYNNFFPELLHIAQDFYAPDSEVSTTKTQFKFLDSSGVKDIATTYTDWYVTDEIAVTPFTFYYITASARSAAHYLYAVYDSSGNILAYESSSSWTIVSIDKKLIYMPYGASKIRIASVSGSSGAALFTAQEKGVAMKWVGKKWAAMGDSLTAVNDTASAKYHTLIADKTGINVVNLGAGGTGYKKEYNGVSGFVNRADTIPLDSDVVTIFGSGNDGSFTIGNPTDTGTDTLCGCINTTIERIFARIPTCKLGIITPTPWQAYNPATDTNWMYRYSSAIVQICKNWGVPCLDLYHCSNLRPWDSDFRDIAYSNADGVHPNNIGHAIFAPRIEAFLDSLLLH